MAKRQGRKETWSTRTFTLTNGDTCEQGKLAVLDTSTGKLVVPATEATGLVAVGRYMESVTASGDTPVKVELFREVKIIWWENSGVNAVGATDLLTTCYIEDDETVSTNSTSTSVAGTVWGISSTYGVAVEMA